MVHLNYRHPSTKSEKVGNFAPLKGANIQTSVFFVKVCTKANI